MPGQRHDYSLIVLVILIAALGLFTVLLMALFDSAPPPQYQSPHH